MVNGNIDGRRACAYWFVCSPVGHIQMLKAFESQLAKNKYNENIWTSVEIEKNKQTKNSRQRSMMNFRKQHTRKH